MDSEKIKRIFIVDDDEMLTTALEDFLSRKIPHEIRTFSTGEKCLEQLSEKPDFIILDYYLNTVTKDAANGAEILASIRKADPGIRVIMLSSQERYGVAMQTLQKGAEQYVIKDENSFEKIEAMVNEPE